MIPLFRLASLEKLKPTYCFFGLYWDLTLRDIGIVVYYWKDVWNWKKKRKKIFQMVEASNYIRSLIIHVSISYFVEMMFLHQLQDVMTEKGTKGYLYHSEFRDKVDVLVTHTTHNNAIV